jgi:hypothetical protein
MTMAAAVGVKTWPSPIRTSSAKVTSKAADVVASNGRYVHRAPRFTTTSKAMTPASPIKMKGGAIRAASIPNRAYQLSWDSRE